LPSTQAACWLVNCYNAHLRLAYGVEYAFKLRGTSNERRAESLALIPRWSRLVVALDYLRGCGVTPMDWIRWSLWCWQRYELASKRGRGNKPWPALSWMFSLTRMRDNWQAMRAFVFDHGHTLWVPPAAYELAALVDRARREASQLPADAADSAVLEIRARYLPGRLFDKLVWRAQDEAERGLRAMTAMRDRGEPLALYVRHIEGNG
jgi:hypothetical protein